jgi:hypothetical protein
LQACSKVARQPGSVGSQGVRQPGSQANRQSSSQEVGFQAGGQSVQAVRWSGSQAVKQTGSQTAMQRSKQAPG